MLAHIIAGDMGQAGVEMLVGGVARERAQRRRSSASASRASTRRG